MDWSARSVTVCEVDRPALVLGSTQPADHVDGEAAATAGVAVARRHSGGAAVLVEPGAMVWVDVIVPARDPLWHRDVGRAGWWLGEAWAAALADLGRPGASVHRDGLQRRRWSERLCFAGLGPGEVTAADGAKVVGVAQRRTREGALFQCAVPLRWDVERVAVLLTLSPEQRADLAADLTGVVSPLSGADPATVVDALVRHLPTVPGAS